MTRSRADEKPIRNNQKLKNTETMSNSQIEDRNLLLLALQKSSKALQLASDEHKADRGIAMIAVKKNGAALQYVSEELKNDPEICLEALNRHDMAFRFVSDALKSDKKFMLSAVKLRRGALFKRVSRIFMNDYDIVKAAVTLDGNLLKLSCMELRNNREIVSLAATENGDAFCNYASNELRQDRQLCLIAARTSNKVVSKTCQQFSGDREIVLEAVRFEGTLEVVSDELKNDREVILTAISSHGRDIQYAPQHFKNDREIVLKAVNQSWKAIEFVHDLFGNDREIVLCAVKQHYNALEYASDEFKNDIEIVNKALRGEDGYLRCRECYNFMPLVGQELRCNHDFMIEIVKEYDICAMHFMRQSRSPLLNDLHFMLEIVKTNGELLHFASEELLNNRELAITAFKESKYQGLFYILPYELRNDREIVSIVSKSKFDWQLFRHNDMEEFDSQFLQHVDSEELLDDFDIVLNAVNGLMILNMHRIGYVVISTSSQKQY